MLDRLKTFATEYRENLARDFPASIVVFLVALPLCMGVAIASGVPPADGIITGIVGGLIVGFFSGSPLQVSGPAAGLTVIVFEIVKEHGVPALGIIVLLAGIVQCLAGVFKLGQWFRAVSPAVINGMLSGIGVLIVASQFHVMLDDSPKGNGVANLISIPVALWDCLKPVGITNTHVAGCVGLLSILVLVLWSTVPKKFSKMLPAALISVVVATAVTIIFQLDIKTVNLPDNLLAALQFPTEDALKKLTNTKIILEALGIALIASAETLLSAGAVDRLHQGQRTKYDRELMAQGIGNIICGAVGALPMTGVIVRSSVNVGAGAVTRASAILHGLWLLMFVACLPFVLKMIPVCSLAAILVYTGFKLTNFSIVNTLIKYGKTEVAIYVITVLTIVCEDLLTGVGIGLALSAAKLLYIFSHLDIRIEQLEDRVELHLKGAATFLNLPKLAELLEGIPPGTELHVHFDELDYIDHAALDMLMNWELQHKSLGGDLVIDWHTLGSMFRERRKTLRPKGFGDIGDLDDSLLQNEETVGTEEAEAQNVVYKSSDHPVSRPSLWWLKEKELAELSIAVAKGQGNRLKRYLEPLGLEERIDLLRRLADNTRILHSKNSEIPVLVVKLNWCMEEGVTYDSKLRHHLEIQLRKEVLKIFTGDCLYKERLFLYEPALRRETQYHEVIAPQSEVSLP